MKRTRHGPEQIIAKLREADDVADGIEALERGDVEGGVRGIVRGVGTGVVVVEGGRATGRAGRAVVGGGGRRIGGGAARGGAGAAAGEGAAGAGGEGAGAGAGSGGAGTGGAGAGGGAGGGGAAGAGAKPCPCTETTPRASSLVRAGAEDSRAGAIRGDFQYRAAMAVRAFGHVARFIRPAIHTNVVTAACEVDADPRA